MFTDPIADLLTRIRNAGKAQHEDVTVSHSNLKENILKVLKEKGFIENYEVEGESAKKDIRITLKEERTNLSIRRVSKPGQRIYVKFGDLKTIKSGLGITVVSTSKGVMSGLEAKRQKLGGELICEVF
ncbi:MAG: 30S ribosomal protein S8 [Candidatus Gracilibacteria bacterium]